MLKVTDNRNTGLFFSRKEKARSRGFSSSAISKLPFHLEGKHFPRALPAALCLGLTSQNCVTWYLLTKEAEILFILHFLNVLISGSFCSTFLISPVQLLNGSGQRKGVENVCWVSHGFTQDSTCLPCSALRGLLLFLSHPCLPPIHFQTI